VSGCGKQSVFSDFPKMKFPKKFTEVIQGLGNILYGYETLLVGSQKKISDRLLARVYKNRFYDSFALR